MIPAGRTAIDASGIAAIHGITLGTLRNNKTYDQPDFPRPLNTRGRRKLWDLTQVRAHAAGQPVPPLPSEAHPDDLLDDYEAAEAAEVEPTTWKTDVRRGRVHDKPRTIRGVRHWHRRTIDAYRDRPRGRPGRPTGATDSKPRRRRRNPQREHAAQLLKQAAEARTTITARTIAAEVGVDIRTVERWLPTLRQELAEAKASKNQGPPTAL